MSEKTINEQFVKLSGKVPFPKPLQLGEDLTVVIQGEFYTYNVVKSEDMDLQDGQIDRVFTLKCIAE